MFRRFFPLLVVTVTVAVVSSFVPSISKPRRSYSLYACAGKKRDEFLEKPLGFSMSSLESPSSQRILDRNDCRHEQQRASLNAGIGTKGLKTTMMICWALLFSTPQPTKAIMTTPDVSVQTTTTITTTESSSTFPTTTTSNPSLVSDSSFTISGLADTLKEKAREIQEKQEAAAAERDARNKAFDDLFDQAEKERNEYYSKKIISRDTYLQNLREGGEIGRFDSGVSPTDELRTKLEQSLQEQESLRLKLVENRQKDQDNRETKVERTLLRIALEKSENESAKLRKDISLAGSIETIRLQREAEAKVYQERAELREKEKQEAIANIRKIREREAAAFDELRARKKQEVKDLKFANSQLSFERKFEDLEKFDQRKGIVVLEPAATTTTRNVDSNEEQEGEDAVKANDLSVGETTATATTKVLVEP